jgi:hypothetical protein
MKTSLYLTQIVSFTQARAIWMWWVGSHILIITMLIVFCWFCLMSWPRCVSLSGRIFVAGLLTEPQIACCCFTKETPGVKSLVRGFEKEHGDFFYYYYERKASGMWSD